MLCLLLLGERPSYHGYQSQIYVGGGGGWHVCIFRIHLCFAYRCWKCSIVCTRSPQVCLWCLRDSALVPVSMHKAPSGTQVPKLERISVSHWRFCKSRIHLRFTYWCWQCGVVCTDGPPVCLGWLRDSAPMPISTQKAPSARTIGDFRQSLAFLHVSHPPALYILVLAVQCLLHTQPSGVTVGSVGLSLDAHRHSCRRHPGGPQCLNCS